MADIADVPEPDTEAIGELDEDPQTGGETDPETGTDPETDPATGAPVVNIDIDVNVDGDNVTIEIGEDGNVIIGDDGTIIDGDGAVVEAPPVLDENGNPIATDPAILDQRELEDNAREAAFYEKLWQEKAAEDPLGRSADELRLAWEEREAIPLEVIAPGESAVGYTSTPLPGGGTSIRFEIFIPETTTSIPTIGALR